MKRGKYGNRMTIQLINADRSIDAVRLRIDERSGNLSACATPDNVEVMIRQDSFYWTNSLKKKPTAWQGQEVTPHFAAPCAGEQFFGTSGYRKSRSVIQKPRLLGAVAICGSNNCNTLRDEKLGKL